MTTPTRPRRAFLGAYEPPKPIDEMTDEERRAFAESVADVMAAAYRRAGGADGPHAVVPLRARDERRRVRLDPTAEQLHSWVLSLGHPNCYLVIDRLGRVEGDDYAQVLHRRDGTWVVEYRDGGRTQHYQTVLRNPYGAAQVIIGWALGLPRWREGLTWRAMYQ